MIKNFDEEMDQKFWEVPLKDFSFDKNVQNYVLDDSLDQKPDRFEKYASSIVPDTQNFFSTI